MEKLSAQGSISIRRVRNGDTLFLSFNTNGIALFQGVDSSSGEVSPDWTVEANQPVITPVVNSAKGNPVTTQYHSWKYLGVTLSFTGATVGDFIKDSTGKFAINTSTGALKIIKNLASTTNFASDLLEYQCVATLDGVEYNLSKSIEIMITTFGASSYIGLITATTEQLTATVSSTTLNAELRLAKGSVDFYPKWYKGNLSTPWTGKNGSKSPVATRTDVDGTTLFICEFYKSEGDTTPVYRAGIRIIDTLDDFQVVFGITSANKTVDVGKPVEVTGRVVNMRTNAEVAADGTWNLYVMNTKDWTTIRSTSGLKSAGYNKITISTDDTDRDGEFNDVEVIGDVTWNE